MSDLPRVTIVTPSFNQARFLEQTLCSVLDQGYPNLEYFVVDGGSTDGSLEIINRYADRLSWWVSEKDRGQAEAINKGLSRATGEFTAWLNSDDVYLPGAIQAAVEAFQRNPQAGMVYGDALAIDATGKITNRVQLGDWTLENLMQFNILWQPAVFMRRILLEKAGLLDLEYHFLLDHQLWLRLAQQGLLVHLPKTLAAARFHKTAKNVSRASEFGREAMKVVAWMRLQPELRDRMDRLGRRIEAAAFRFNGRYLLDAGMPWQALKSYGKSLVLHPPTALSEWHRMVYALFCLVGLGQVKRPYFALRRRLTPAVQSGNIADLWEEIRH